MGIADDRAASQELRTNTDDYESTRPIRRRLIVLVLRRLRDTRRRRFQVGQWHDWPSDGLRQRHALVAVEADRRSNVTRLRRTWTYRTGEARRNPRVAQLEPFECTPFDDRRSLVCSTPYNRVAALNPETGAEKWKFDASHNNLGNGNRKARTRGVCLLGQPFYGWSKRESSLGAYGAG